MNELEWIVSIWIQRFTGTLSIIGSSSIIIMILLDRGNKLIKPNHRMMLAMSVFDVFSSTALATATWPYPKETLVHGAVGNATTCKIQFFFIISGLAVPMYNASLSLLYLLTIRYSMHHSHFATRFERYLHVVSILIPPTVAALSIMTGEVGPGKEAPFCGQSPDSIMTWPILWILFVSFFICLYSMTMVSCYVWTKSNKLKQYTYSTRQQDRQNEKTKATIQQAILYTLAFVITFLFPLIGVFSWSYFVTVMRSIFFPLQGFWNFLLYTRPLIEKKRKELTEKCLLQIIWNVVFHSHARKQNQPRGGDATNRKNEITKQSNLRKGDATNRQIEITKKSNLEASSEPVKSILVGNQNEEDLENDRIHELHNRLTSSIDRASVEVGEGNLSSKTDPHAPSDNRVSFFFATTADDKSIHSFDSQDSNEKIKLPIAFATTADDKSIHSFDSQDSNEEIKLPIA